jgi:hypothetical protein
MTEMRDVPFQHAQQHIVGIYFSCVFAMVVDYMLLKADGSFLGQPSMVAELSQWIEKQDEALKPMLQTALKDTSATAIASA